MRRGEKRGRDEKKERGSKEIPAYLSPFDHRCWSGESELEMEMEVEMSAVKELGCEMGLVMELCSAIFVRRKTPPAEGYRRCSTDLQD